MDRIGLLQYVTSSDFAVDVAENWQSEYLQFLLYITLTAWFVQRGSPESKPVDEHRPGSPTSDQMVGRWARRRLPPLGPRVAAPGAGSVLHVVRAP